jgi:hypothetical protein
VARTIEIEGIHDSSTARLIATNLSLGGVYCTSDRDFPEMTRLAVRLFLPEKHADARDAALDVDAVVVRREKAERDPGAFELALLFTSLSEQQRDRLARFLA